MKVRLALKAALFTALLPGTGVLVVPLLIVRQSGALEWPAPSVLTILAGMMGMSGIGFLLHCIWGFAVHGQGTLAPVAPPSVLVVSGLYRYTRNPMYHAVLCVLLSEAILFSSLGILVYAGIGFLCFHLFVLLHEEPWLRRQFGKAYEDYCRAVPRWGMTLRPFDGERHTTGSGN